MSEPTKAAKDWAWWLKSVHARSASVGECIHEAQAYIAELEAEVERLERFIKFCVHEGMRPTRQARVIFARAEEGSRDEK